MKEKRKKIAILLIILLLSSSKQFAQTYYPIPSNHANWNEVFTREQPYSIISYKHVLHNDTIINSVRYHKVFYLSGSDTSIHNPSQDKYYAAMRNDTINRKVFVLFKDSLAESLLYDFSKNVGDTISYFYHQVWYKLVISKIDYVLIQGKYRKQFHLGWDEKWIEGIGCTEGLFYPKYALPTCFCHWILGCLWQNDSLIYLNPEFEGICGLTSVYKDKTKDREYIIQPNPANHKITISTTGSPQKESLVNIYNIQGELLLSNTFALQNSLEMDVSSLARGVYIIKIQAGDGFETKKLVIQ